MGGTLKGKETVSIQIQGNKSALKGAREAGLIEKMKKFKRIKQKRSDASCFECLAKTLSYWHWGPIDNIWKNELKDLERILEL